MSRIRSFAVASTFGLALVASVVAGAPGASAADASTITIHHRLCPTDQVISDYFADCHDELVGQSFGFTINHNEGSTELTTDAATSDGSATVPAGEVEISGGVPGEFAETFVYCSQDGEGIDLTKTAIGYSFTAPAGEVVCDWFNTPVDLSGGGSDNGDDDDQGGVTQLPNTGIGEAGADSNDLFLMVLAGLGLAGAGSLALRTRQN